MQRDESAFENLNIFEWNNPPYDLGLYNEKSFVYGIEEIGVLNFRRFLSYLKEHIQPEQGAELIRFWAGIMIKLKNPSYYDG